MHIQGGQILTKYKIKYTSGQILTKNRNEYTCGQILSRYRNEYKGWSDPNKVYSLTQGGYILAKYRNQK